MTEEEKQALREKAKREGAMIFETLAEYEEYRDRIFDKTINKEYERYIEKQ